MEELAWKKLVRTCSVRVAGITRWYESKLMKTLHRTNNSMAYIRSVRACLDRAFCPQTSTCSTAFLQHASCLWSCCTLSSPIRPLKQPLRSVGSYSVHLQL